jgi:predicted transcriptional regulator
MENILKLFDAEYKFMSIVWALEPVNSTELTRICESELGWKKPTTYSMIRKLCERGIMKNEKATVTTLIAREDVQKYEAGVFIDRVFKGSIPSFITSFLQGKEISEEEARNIKRLIDEVTKK